MNDDRDAGPQLGIWWWSLVSLLFWAFVAIWWMWG